MNIVLLTDFGQSEYVGIMKGVIRCHNKTANIIDLTHSITSHKIIEAAWILFKSYRFFPKKSTFCVVVDPGVGTGRKAVAIKTKNYQFVGPDNGVLWQAATENGIEEVVLLSTEKAESTTFHGRDVFAPAAACISTGLSSLSSLGPPFELKQRLELAPSVSGKGMVVRIDHFGNIITNLPYLPTSKVLHVRFSETNKPVEMTVCRTFADGPSNKPIIIVGSAGTLEIAVKNARAIDQFGVQVGEEVELLNL
ncbi:MAG: SAM hydrolase/SAM-dependent halogenase family protein [Candidatus Hodarchaeales archaeon]|jgi:S-adenosylmethionine hydrolase